MNRLFEGHRAQFPKWTSLLYRGYSILCHGLGSKKKLLEEFHQQIVEKDCVVVNGFFPFLTIKQILKTITEDILEISGNFSSTSEHLEEIFSRITTDLFLIIHNIDGQQLRTRMVQSVICRLISHPRIHLVCSLDHINAPLLWDQQCMSNLNPIWFDCTTFLPYTEEGVGGDKKTELSSLGSVWPSLTPNARKIYIIIIK
jgi:origin recognition complex subunit 2